MKMSGYRILKTTAVVVGISALGALGSATAFAATPVNLGNAPDVHGTSPASETGRAAPASSKSGDLHTFAMPKMATPVAEPGTRYDDNNYNNDSSGYGSTRNGSKSNNYDSNNNGYDSNSGNSYNSNYDNGYSNNGYSNNGYRRNGSGLLGGGLLGGNN